MDFMNEIQIVKFNAFNIEYHAHAHLQNAKIRVTPDATPLLKISLKDYSPFSYFEHILFTKKTK